MTNIHSNAVPAKLMPRWRVGDRVRSLATGETGHIGTIDVSSGNVQLREWTAGDTDDMGRSSNWRTRWHPPDWFELAPDPAAKPVEPDPWAKTGRVAK